MNLFYLDEDLDKCAEAHMDCHVGKMQLEITQMLCTNLWIDEVLGYIPRKVTSDELSTIRSAAEAANFPVEVRYKPCFHNHPCTIWMRQSYENWEYSVLLVSALNSESMWRGNKPHKSHALALRLSAPKSLPSKGFITPHLAMPDEFKSDDPVQSYRAYYKSKADLASWKRRDPPEWWFSNPKNYRDAKSLHQNSRSPDAQNMWKKQMDEIIRMQAPLSSEVPWKVS